MCRTRSIKLCAL